MCKLWRAGNHEICLNNSELSNATGQFFVIKNKLLVLVREQIPALLLLDVGRIIFHGESIKIRLALQPERLQMSPEPDFVYFSKYKIGRTIASACDNRL